MAIVLAAWLAVCVFTAIYSITCVRIFKYGYPLN